MNKQDRAGRSGLVAAYREGLGLAAIAVIGGPNGVRVAAAERVEDLTLAALETIQTRWWCRRAADADRVVRAAAARLRRSQSRADACDSIAQAAKRLLVVLQSDETVAEEAAVVIARTESEFERLRHAGDLRSVNKSYQTYRIEATARGERVVPYAQWISRYKEDLVRKLASALRYL